MSQNKNRRSRVKARRQLNATAWANAIANSQPTPAADVAELMVLIRMAYQRLERGDGTDKDFNIVAAVMNVGMVRAEAIVPALVDAFKAGGEAVLECERIRSRHGKYGFRAADLVRVKEAMELYEEILTLSSPNQMTAAAEECDKRFRAGEVVTA